MNKSVGLRSLSVSFPSIIRTNDYWRSKYPDAVADAQQRTLARLFSAKSAEPPTAAFDIEMAPYLSDPFRGTVERRALPPGETATDLEMRAAEQAIAASGIPRHEIGAVMVSSMIPDMVGL